MSKERTLRAVVEGIKYGFDILPTGSGRVLAEIYRHSDNLDTEISVLYKEFGSIWTWNKTPTDKDYKNARE